MPYWVAATHQALWGERYSAIAGLSPQLADELATEAEELILAAVGGLGALAVDLHGFDAAMVRAVGIQVQWLATRQDPRVRSESRGSRSSARDPGADVDPLALAQLQRFRRRRRTRIQP